MAKNPYQIQAEKMRLQCEVDRKKFLEVYAETRDKKAALAAVNHPIEWVYRNGRKYRDFFAAYQAIGRGAKTLTTLGRYNGDWDGTFSSFRQVFLGRDHTAFYHERIGNIIATAKPGSVHLVITPPYHAKTAIAEDHCSYELATDPTVRITYGHSQIEQAKKSLGVVRARMDYGMDDFADMQRQFGPFAPNRGMNEQGSAQVWAAGEFNTYKKPVGVERDFSMRALGMNSNIAGTRSDRMYIDDPQEVKTLNLTDSIMGRLRDDWFTRTGGLGVTIILMNVVGDGDIAEELIRSDTCQATGGTVTILKAVDEKYRDLGPRHHKDGRHEESPYLWPEYHDEQWYDVMKAKVGPESWERKFQQDWRPATTRTFTKKMIEQCSNPHRSVLDPVPRHPSGGPAEIAIAFDPGFTRAGISVVALEPTMFRVLDSVALVNARTFAQQIDLVADRVRYYHHPPVSVVKWVTVETKGFQRGLVEDDAFLELAQDVHFEVIKFETDWKKNDNDFGITQLARSLERSEMDFPAGDGLSKARFEPLFSEMFNWRPSRGNKLQQDLLVPLWFNFVKWHKIRRQSIRRPTDAGAFGFAPLPTSPLVAAVTPSDWRFGIALDRR